MGNKKDYEETRVEFDGAGNEIYIFNGPLGERPIKKLDMSVWLPTGEQYCPECHCQIAHKNDYWRCEKCGYEITDDDADNGNGYPTRESTYENDYGTYYGTDNDDEDDLD